MRLSIDRYFANWSNIEHIKHLVEFYRSERCMRNLRSLTDCFCRNTLLELFMFCPCMFFSFFCSPLVLWSSSTDRRETLQYDRNLALFYNASPKILGALLGALPPPQKKNGGGQKHMQNFGIFDFDREYLRNGSTSNIWKKNLINRNPFHVGRKNGELWSTNKKVLEVHTGPPTSTFFWRLHFGP